MILYHCPNKNEHNTDDGDDDKKDNRVQDTEQDETEYSPKRSSFEKILDVHPQTSGKFLDVFYGGTEIEVVGYKEVSH